MKKLRLDELRQQFADFPSTLVWLEANFDNTNEDLIEQLLDDVDESHYSLSEWIDALIVMRQWLDSRGLHAALADQIGFVSCANSAVGAGANLTSLSSIVSEMLDSYGFERAAKK